MGNQLWIMISDPFLAHDIFVKAGSSTSSRPYHRFTTDLYNMNDKGLVFTAYNNKWKSKRKTAIALLSPGSVDKFTDVLEVEADSLMERFGKIAQNGTLIDPFDQLQLTSMNIILTVMAATRFDDVDHPDFVAINKYLYHAMIYAGAAGDLGSFLPSLAWTDVLTGTEKKLRKLLEEQRDPVYKKIIKNAGGSEKSSLVKDMFKMKDEGDLNDDEILVLFSDLLAAGADTVAVSLYWAFAILSQKPDVQTKIIEELDAWKAKNPPGAVPSFHKDREEFPYSICVQKEVIRFRPVTNFGIPHMTSEDVIVNDYFIPKNAILISSMCPMHANADVYENPDQFIPERFMKNTNRMGAAANTKIEDRDHFAFGWGRRICPGIHLAEIEIFNFFVRFFSKFTMAPELDSQGNPIPIDLDDYVDEGIIMKPVHYKVRIVHRT
ncbi:hypothetical protein G6F55_011727 [Rhizopus delemar]|uniref:Cytochrome P450 n=3 Tax=Rhizopus TaxID=4842 RepID=I1CD01_RHIO9|nr:hypothetical protein RO3G_11042 [Rhizopus delemar RA 99-880]KAG1445997.1 hypothetical protein G6F55_011727 [Rhizopus delemar]KAG1534298.1 hypothetical protein G6F51_012173 [Rhizopus arrhizus]KAG1497461.1 hypothetical protein G6F53_011964 [Rhizopus delemar]KAG1499127.1 hypothetical protein G6F54_004611 [Rhizopus delemar]|eukprot:EIE86331.1 hypothetical protein RO3G_11042 [Rhizopus delemar RA 99-880]